MSETTGPPPAEGVSPSAERVSPSQPVPDAPSTPPALAPVEAGAPVPPGSPAERNVPIRWLVAGLATVAVIGAVVVAWLFLGQQRAETASAAWLPSDAVGYIEVSADLTAGQRDHVLALLQRFPGFEDQSHLGDKLDETFQRVLGQVDLDYRAQVKPWLGSSVAIGVRAPAAGAAAHEPSMVVLVASTNDTAAAAFVDTVAHRASAKNASVTEETYRGIRVTTVSAGTGPDAHPAHALAVVDGRLVAGTPDLVHAVIDVRHGGAAALAGADTFRSAIASLPGERVGSLWLDAAGLLAGARTELQTLSPAAGLISFTPGSALVGSLQAGDDGLVLEVSGRGSIAGAALLSASPGIAAPRAGRLAASAPAQTAVFIDLHDVGQALTTVLAAARQGDPSSGATIDQLDRTLALLGTNVNELAGAVGDGALVMTLASGESPSPRFALVLEAKDKALATRLVSQVDALAGLSGLGHITTRDEKDVTIHRLELTSGTLPGGTAALTFALAGDVLIVGLDEDLVVSIIDARRGGATLAGDADYTSVTAQVGADSNGAVFVDLEQLIGAFGTRGLSAEERAFLAPLRAVGVAIRAPGEQEWLGTSRLFVRIR